MDLAGIFWERLFAYNSTEY